MSKSATLIVNLYGGPGSGKSTNAAGAFYAMKSRGINCEYVQEYAKDICWEGRHYLFSDQLYVFAKQNRRLERLYDKVDVAITDCPLLLSYFYGRNPHHLALIKEFWEKAPQLHIFLVREKPYSEAGRMQTEEEARAIDVELRRLMDKIGIPYWVVFANKEAPEAILDIIAMELASPRSNA